MAQSIYAPYRVVVFWKRGPTIVATVAVLREAWLVAREYWDVDGVRSLIINAQGDSANYPSC